MTETSHTGVLLDVDGALLDTGYLHALAWWRAFRDAGHEGGNMLGCTGRSGWPASC